MCKAVKEGIMIFIKLPVVQRIDPYYFALEEYLLEKFEETVFIWDVFNSVIIGKNQLLQNEINVDVLHDLNIKVYRRPSGGGAVYNDYGCIKYSFISKRPKDEMYYAFLGEIKAFLAPFIQVEFSGRNDLTYQDQKFSGNAYYQTKEGHVLHGTLLYDTDLSVLSSVLNPSKAKLKSKGITSVKSRVTNLKEHVRLSREEFRVALDQYFSKYEVYELTEEDEANVKELMKKYNSDAYIHGTHPLYQIKVNERYPFGEVEVHMNIKNRHIDSIRIYGDFFEKESIEGLEKLLTGISVNHLDIILDMNPGIYIEGMENKDLYELLKKGVLQ